MSQRVRREPTPVSWEPPDDLLANVLAELRGSNAALWEEIKAVEVRGGNLFSCVGDDLTILIATFVPDRDGVKMANLLYSIREVAGREARQNI